MSSQLPINMKAIIGNENKARVAEMQVPKLRPSYLLAKVDSIALNPTDWKHINGKRGSPDGLAGCDFSGTVVEVGPDVSKTFKPGDRIAGTTHGSNYSNPEDGCFAEYAVAKADLVIKIPDHLSFEDAATLPLGVFTVGQGLYQKALKLDLPTEPTHSEDWVLIYGGSSATGSLAVQYAKLSGYKVISTCRPHNIELVKSRGAEHVFDYNDPACGTGINKDTNDSLQLIWDTISTESSAKVCADALSSHPANARYGTILPVKLPGREKDAETTFTFMYTIFNEAFHKAGRFNPALQEDFDFAKKFAEITEKLLAEGKLKPHPAKVGPDGLEGALQGMEDMKENRVSGFKMVYRVRDTPIQSTKSVHL